MLFHSTEQQNAILQYCKKMSSKEDPLLIKLDRQTGLKTLAPQMISGHLQGKLLEIISRMCKPHVIFDIGTFTGYSALCLVKGIQNNGKLLSFESNPERESLIREFWRKSDYEHYLELIIGDAYDEISKYSGPVDLAFIDADKQRYLDYYKMLKPMMSSQGCIIVDNTLWSGKVLKENLDQETAALKRFNHYVAKDDDVDCVLLPLRDGLTILTLKN